MTITCGRCREAFSARMDGEDTCLPAALVDEHLRGCDACRAWQERAHELTRAVRVHEAVALPDLAGRIMAAIAEISTDAVPAGSAAYRPSSVVRLTLALVAFSQVIIALPAVLGNDLGAPVHVAHEQAAWGLALAAALALASWRPSQAAALLPFLAVFVGVLAALTLSDVIAGRVALGAELPHLMAALGLVLLWLESHPPLELRDRRPLAPSPAGPHGVAA